MQLRLSLSPSTSHCFPALADDETGFLAEGTIIAVGVTPSSSLPSDHHPALHPNLTPTRTLLRLSRILTPAAILSLYSGRHNLGHLSSTTRYLVVKTARLRELGVEAPLEPEVGGARREQDELLGEDIGGDDTGEYGARVRGVDEEVPGVDEAAIEDDVEHATANPEAGELAEKLFAPLREKLASLPSSSLPYSRVLLDIWHGMDRIPTPKRHGVQAAFARALSAAMLVPYTADKALLDARLRRQGSSFDAKVLSDPKWVWARCRRRAPPPADVAKSIMEVCLVFGPLQDAKTGLPLFNKACWHAAARLIADAMLGYLSDPPDVDLYTVIKPCGGPDGTLRDGVNIYRCSRGINSTEGGVHRNLRHQFAGSNVSVEFAVARILDYMTSHNLLVGTLNRTGKRFDSHFDIWTLDRVQYLTDLVSPLIASAPLYSSWTNGGMYAQTNETYGIMPITTTTADDLGITLADSHPSFDPHALPPPPPPSTSAASTESSTRKRQKSEPPIRFTALARRQGTRFAILHVHTQAERQLFHHYRLSMGFTGTEKQYKAAAREFNKVADGKAIFYKTATHIGHADAAFKTYSNKAASLSRSITVRDELFKKHRSPERPGAADEPSLRPSTSLIVPAGEKEGGESRFKPNERQPRNDLAAGPGTSEFLNFPSLRPHLSLNSPPLPLRTLLPPPKRE
ncbi:hypothetical protein JCM8097_008209 [Rhodosporidiobolus ruineniae]